MNFETTIFGTDTQIFGPAQKNFIEDDIKKNNTTSIKISSEFDLKIGEKFQDNSLKNEKISEKNLKTSKTTDNSNINSKSNDKSIETWLWIDGPAFLNDSLKKLKLDLGQINKSFVEKMGVSELEEKKKAVKNELKKYDFLFESTFNRLPLRNEKEPLRPIYIFYKLIKQYLEKAQIIPNNYSPNISKDSNNNYSGNSKSFENHKKLKLDTSETNKQEKPLKMNINELRKRLEELKKMKNDLRNKLHSFQTNFTKDNNRKIKYHKDIAPVEDDYKTYKEIKMEIQKIEELLNNGKKPIGN